ncbi:MAG: membrane protein insertion efficiency factor YidD [Clostridia bacterium]|nr:membrane protein insertion efficiency factor YidD [Clostridia bacterium]
MKKILIFLVRFYQKNISPRKIACCRFTPTCSQYAIEAISTHGAVKGTALSLWRILRCNPFCKGGYDPVPPKKETKH